MSPATIALIVSLVEEIATSAPEVYASLKSIFSNPNPTPADWEALRAQVLAKTYADYVPQSDLPAANAAPDTDTPEVAPVPAAANNTLGHVSPMA